jgi:hypothetical protein
VGELAQQEQRLTALQRTVTELLRTERAKWEVLQNIVAYTFLKYYVLRQSVKLSALYVSVDLHCSVL